jgi:predicted dehydrogenase
MTRTFRIGVLGLTHDHVWGNLREMRDVPNAVLSGVADPNPPLLDRVRGEYGCPTYAGYEELLDREPLDAVYLYSDNATSVELTELAAGRGLHVLVEKPMAADLAGAERMQRAVRRAGVRLMVNWPFAWWPQLHHALALARAGDVGDVWQVKYRAAHAGPRELGCSPYFTAWLYDRQLNGAGALIDYCCYGVLLSRCLLGMPSRVVGVAGRLVKEELAAEDNGILLLTYPRAVGVAEGSWTQVGHLTSYITTIHGSRGTLLVEPRTGGRLLRATAAEPAGVPVAVPPLPPEQRSATANFLHGLETGADFNLLCTDRAGRDVQEILDAGLQSARLGSAVSLPLPAV